MKAIIIFAAALFFYFQVNGQSYQQGDIGVTYQGIFINHNNQQCYSDVLAEMNIYISNSFVNDTVKMIDWQGNVITQSVNISGDVYWNPVNFQYPRSIYDGDVYGNSGNIPFDHGIHKIISDDDTLYLYSFMDVFVYVPNTCDYNTVSGRIYVDNDNDCTFSSGDESIIWIYPSVTPNYTYAPFHSGTTWGNNNGLYQVRLQESWLIDYTVNIPSIYQFAFMPSPCFQSGYTFTSLPQANVDFPFLCSDLDTRVSMSTTSARPAIPFYMHPRVYNIGCTPVSGTLKLKLDPNVVYDPTNSSNPADLVSGDTLIWNYVNLNNLANNNQGYFNLFLGGIELTPTLAVNIGDVLTFELMTEVHPDDVDPSNNSYTFSVPIVNSYDPNIKEVSPKGEGAEGFISPTTEKLTYTIHFQNTGTAEAINISVIDTLEENLLPRTLRILETSHQMTPEWLNEHTIRFRFPNINLPDSTSNEPQSHGFVRFEVAMEQDLDPGTEIKNKVEIYFDTNEPIVTNVALNTIEFPSGLSVEDLQLSGLKVYPNPTDGVVNFELKKSMDAELLITDITGKVIYQQRHAATSVVQVNTEKMVQGIYVYELRDLTNGGTSAGKLMIR